MQRWYQHFKNSLFPKPKSNKEIFNELSFPGQFLPADFRELINGKYEIINTPEDNETLAHALKQFVNDIIALDAAIKKIIADYNNMQDVSYPNQRKLDAINFPKKDIPQEYLGFNSDNIMTYPVKLNADTKSQCIIDLRALIEFWQQENCRFVNPINHEIIVSVNANIALQQVINDYVATAVRHATPDDVPDAAIETQITAIRDKIKALGQIETSETLLKKTAGKLPKIPAKFTAENIDIDIMTHPVKIDDEAIMCFLALDYFWQQQKEEYPEYWATHPYEHPLYPGKKIRSLIYQDELKKELDQFIQNPNLFLLQQTPLTQAQHATMFASQPEASSETMPTPSIHSSALTALPAISVSKPAAAEAESKVVIPPQAPALEEEYQPIVAQYR